MEADEAVAVSPSMVITEFPVVKLVTAATTDPVESACFVITS